MSISIGTINSNLASGPIADIINSANSKIQNASLQAASGKAINKASDDPAGLAVATGLGIDAQTLSIVSKGSAQANAILGVADGALAGIQDQLAIMAGLSAQANNGSVSSTQRTFFQQQLTQAMNQINLLSTQTTFNGITLLDGSLAGGQGFASNTASAADAAVSSASITFGAGNSAAAAVGVFTINGVGFDFGAAPSTVSAGNILLDDTLTGAQIATTVASIINNTAGGTLTYANMNEQNYERLSDLVATVNGSTLNITSKRTGIGGEFLVTVGATNAAVNVTNIANGSQSIAVPATTAEAIISSVPIGLSTGSLGVSTMSVKGTLNGSMIQTLSQTAATSGWITVSGLTNTVTLNMFGTPLTLENAVTNPSSQILVGANDYETAKNIVSFLNNSTDPNIANYYYEVQLTAGGATQVQAYARSATASVNGAQFVINGVNGTMASGAAAGLDLSHITDNTSFLGTLVGNGLTGFGASFTGTNSVKLSIKAGDYTYQANVLDTAPAANYTIRMKSTDLTGKGGYFDLTIAANQGLNVNNQNDANTFATALNTAINGLTFYQDREIASFKPAGTYLENSVVSMTGKTFSSSLQVSSINVGGSYQNASQNGSMTINLSDGRVFTNTTLGTKSTAGTQINLTNTADSNEIISFILSSDVYYDTANHVTELSNALNSSLSSGQNALTFQVGTQSSQTISVALASATSSALFNGQTLDISTAEGAGIVAGLVQTAIDTVIGQRASVGAYQDRFSSVTDNIQVSIQNNLAAKSVYMDADAGQVSTNLALAITQMNAAVSVLTKTNALSDSLLSLLR